jgi:diguanylate cyclase (GGDEF)-like protein
MVSRIARFKEKLFFILLALGIFISLIFCASYPLRPVGFALNHWWMEENGRQQEITLPILKINESQLAALTLRTSFPYVDADTLVIPRQSGNFIEVKLNGRVVYRVGDLNAPTANLWNYVHLIRLPEPLKEANTLEIRTSSIYMGTGFSGIPFLSRYAKAAQRVDYLNWFYNDLLLMTAGAAFIVGLILILLSCIRRTPSNAEFFLGVALIFCVIYTYDSIFRFTSGDLISFLWIKKLLMSSGYLASLFFIFALEKYFWNQLKISRWFGGLSVLAIIILISVPDLYLLATVVNYANVILAVNLLITVIILYRMPQSKPWLLFPATLMSLSIIQMVLAIPLKIYLPLIVPYAILTNTILFGVNMILEFNQLFHENMHLQRTSNLDPLTGAMNRRVIRDLQVGLHDFVALIDLDNFKDLNDRYGHVVGDKVLVQFTGVVRANLRQNDIVIRWGGDEFLLVLNVMTKNQVGYEEVERILERIQTQYANTNPEMNLSFSYGIEIVEDTFEKSLDLADKRMYQMKEKKLRQINKARLSAV